MEIESIDVNRIPPKEETGKEPVPEPERQKEPQEPVEEDIDRIVDLFA